MQIQVEVRNVRQVQKYLTDVQKKQLPFATALAITNTLYAAKRGVEHQAEKDLDRPTPFTMRAFRVKKADKTSLTGKLFIMPIQRKYLELQIFGGVRKPKGSTLTMLPAVHKPGDIQRDQYGNVPRSRRPKLSIAKGAFSGTINGVAGIWKPPTKTKTGKVRKGSRMQLLFVYERQATYRPRFRFFERGQGEIQANWQREFNKAWIRANRTAY